MNEPLIYIVLLNYNSYNDTIECVESLKKIEYKNYKIIIVDNKSTNDSERILSETVGMNCKVIQSGFNGGFASGNNIGIEYAIKNNAQYVLLLNNDTLVESDFLGKMVETFNIDDKIGIVGNQINYFSEKNKIWFGGGQIKWDRFSGAHQNYGKIDIGDKRVREIDFMTGCCMLIKAEIFQNVGLLPDEYFLYLEDLDFCIAVADKGYKIMYNPNSKIYHKVSAATGGEESAFSVKWGNRNRIILMNKYYYKIEKSALIKAKAFFYISRIAKYIKYLTVGESDKARAMVEGIKLGRSFIKSKI
jgi:GT2 family glycosyltransferase